MAEQANNEAAPVETKADKFKRITAPRVEKALDAIALIANSANKAQYEWTPEQVEKIATLLKDRVNKTIGAFASDAPKAESRVEL